jgi:hypothetical protein
MAFFLETLLGGLMAGMLYSLVALGFVLIYKASGVFNFAQGAMVLFAALAMARFAEWLNASGLGNLWLVNLIAFAMAAVVMFCVAWVIEQDKGLKLPKRLQADFSRHVQALADEAGRELNATDIWRLFEATYLPGPADRFVLRDYEETGTAGQRVFVGHVAIDGEERSIAGRGNGLISGVIAALGDSSGAALDVVDYSEHALGQGADAQAVAYVECRTSEGRTVFGVGLDTDIATASVRAVLSAANRF